MIRRDPKYDLRSGYRRRLLACGTGVLLLANMAVMIWPASSGHSPEAEPTRIRAHEVIRISDVIPTRQDAAPHDAGEAPQPVISTPPTPVIPTITIPDASTVEEPEPPPVPLFAIETGPAAGSGDEAANPPGATGNEADTVVATGILVPPRPLRLVEPEYSREARRKRVKAEIKIEVLVDTSGHVRQTKVLERYLRTSSGKERVALLGHGLEEAALSAAERWHFHPARKDGRPVEYSYVLSMKLGS